ncbi:hypothetical protein KR200_009579, partial [Drosophila serrata]
MSIYRRASMTARQRQTRAGRMTRYSIFTMKRPFTFQVRKSLVEYVDIELADMDTSVFYQRIFILAKNAHLTPEETEPEVEPEPVQADQSEGVSTVHPTLEFKEDMIIPMDDVSLSQEEAEEEASVEVPSEMARTSADPDQEVLTHTFRFSGFETAEEFIGDEDDRMTVVSTEVKPKDFFDVFSDVLKQLHKQCKEVAITPDPMCGLYMYMGDYSLLMLESSEDMIGCFTKALLECCDTYWVTNRVFQIEDHITELYTNELIFRRMPAVFLNEKFPTSTPTDEYLMGKQHLIIKDKLHTICRMLLEQVDQGDQSEMDGDSTRESLDDEEDFEQTKSKTKSLLIDQVPIDLYRKHLPEIQRIELVLASTRFYYELDDFAKLYGQVPFARDEEGHFWPIQNNYTPPHIFRRTPYDINLTFADYASAATRKRTLSLVSENSGGEDGAEEEGAAKEDGAAKGE